MRTTNALLASALLALAAAAPRARSQDVKTSDVAVVDTAKLVAAVERGSAALHGQQAQDGHWGTSYPIAETAMAGLALLATEERPLDDPAVAKAYSWLLSQQTDGSWNEAQHWVHTQGFATLFCAELYGQVLFAKAPPAAFSKEALAKLVTAAATHLARAQSKSGGWWYTPSPEQDEGSTTVCAVQALRAARNFGIPVEPHVLERGFAYLKAMQNRDGGFRYMASYGGSMNAGTAAAVATLVLMNKLDEKVLLDAVGFLDHLGVEALAHGSSGQYGAFYAAMAMRVLDEEYGAHLPSARRWSRALEAVLVADQTDGAWTGRDVGDASYGTAMSLLALSCRDGRLSVFHRRGPKLPR